MRVYNYIYLKYYCCAPLNDFCSAISCNAEDAVFTGRLDIHAARVDFPIGKAYAEKGYPAFN